MILSKKQKKIWIGLVVVATVGLVLSSFLPLIYTFLR